GRGGYQGAGHGGAHDVDEQHRAVGREGRAGELAVAGEDVAPDRIDPTIRGDALQVVADVARVVVLADHQMAPGRDGQVVAHVDDPLVSAFEEQLQAAAVGGGDVAQDLAAAQRAARCGGHVELAVGPDDSLAAGDEGGAVGVAAQAQVD